MVQNTPGKNWYVKRVDLPTPAAAPRAVNKSISEVFLSQADLETSTQIFLQGTK